MTASNCCARPLSPRVRRSKTLATEPCGLEAAALLGVRRVLVLLVESKDAAVPGTSAAGGGGAECKTMLALQPVSLLQYKSSVKTLTVHPHLERPVAQ